MPKKALAQTLRDLTPLEILALDGAFKKTAVDDAKDKLIDGSSAHVNFTVQIVGHIQKGASTPKSKGMVSQKIDLANLPTTCALLKHFGIGVDRLRAALKTIGVARIDDPEHLELSTVFREVADELSAKLPEVPFSNDGKAGAVTSKLSAQVIE